MTMIYLPQTPPKIGTFWSLAQPELWFSLLARLFAWKFVASFIFLDWLRGSIFHRAQKNSTVWDLRKRFHENGLALQLWASLSFRDLPRMIWLFSGSVFFNVAGRAQQGYPPDKHMMQQSYLNFLLGLWYALEVKVLFLRLKAMVIYQLLLAYQAQSRLKDINFPWTSLLKLVSSATKSSYRLW